MPADNYPDWGSIDPVGSSVIGWGITVNIRPPAYPGFVVPPGCVWDLAVAPVGDGTTQYNTREQLPYTSANQHYVLGEAQTDSFQTGNQIPKDDDSIQITARLLQGSTVVGFASSHWNWDVREGLQEYERYLLQRTTNVGLTTEQAAQLETAATESEQMTTNWTEYQTVTLPSLQDVLNNITTGVTATIQTAAGAVGTTIGELFSGKTLDQISTFSASGGTTCDPIEADFGADVAIYGCVVQVDSFPDWYAFTAPAENWTPRDLAVLTVRRGGDILYRAGVHSTSHMLYPLPGLPVLGVTLSVPIIPPDYHVSVAWGEGVCGQLLMLFLP